MKEILLTLCVIGSLLCVYILIAHPRDNITAIHHEHTVPYRIDDPIVDSGTKYLLDAVFSLPQSLLYFSGTTPTVGQIGGVVSGDMMLYMYSVDTSKLFIRTEIKRSNDIGYDSTIICTRENTTCPEKKTEICCPTTGGTMKLSVNHTPAPIYLLDAIIQSGSTYVILTGSTGQRIDRAKKGP